MWRPEGRHAQLPLTCPVAGILCVQGSKFSARGLERLHAARQLLAGVRGSWVKAASTDCLVFPTGRQRPPVYEDTWGLSVVFTQPQAPRAWAGAGGESVIRKPPPSSWKGLWSSLSQILPFYGSGNPGPEDRSDLTRVPQQVRESLRPQPRVFLLGPTAGVHGWYLGRKRQRGGEGTVRWSYQAPLQPRSLHLKGMRLDGLEVAPRLSDSQGQR